MLDLTALAHRVGGRLLPVAASHPHQAQDKGQDNPWAIEEDPGAFHTTGWFGAYDAGHSAFAVAAESSADIAAAVDFARVHRTGLVIKGTGHDYLGRSSAPGSLLLWTHRMRDITVHDAFIPAGQASAATEKDEGAPAVTVGAGTRWLEVYRALAPHGRFALGGGCTSVGAAGGFTQGGGFGHFSRRYGTAAGNVLEAEVVTASGETLTVNAGRHPDLFWALRGGGGGTFAVVSKLTMRTYPLPGPVVIVAGDIRAASDADFRELVRALVRFLPSLLDEHWGEQVRLSGDNTVSLFLTAAGLTEAAARQVWQPFLAWANERRFTTAVSMFTVPSGSLWDQDFWDTARPGQVRGDHRPGQPSGQFWWATDAVQVGQYLHGFQSRWLPGRLFRDRADELAAALFAASRPWPVTLHLNKGLAGAAEEAVARDRRTSVNPVAFDAAALVIIASGQPQAFPGVPGHQPDLALAAARARQVAAAMEPVRALTPASGSYPNQADYFEPDWQRSFWGANYPRLLAVKRAYDPHGLFRVHHGVGSEQPADRTRDGGPLADNPPADGKMPRERAHHTECQKG